MFQEDEDKKLSRVSEVRVRVTIRGRGRGSVKVGVVVKWLKLG